jgi:hypothetical protein
VCIVFIMWYCCASCVVSVAVALVVFAVQLTAMMSQ